MKKAITEKSSLSSSSAWEAAKPRERDRRSFRFESKAEGRLRSCVMFAVARAAPEALNKTGSPRPEGRLRKEPLYIQPSSCLEKKLNNHELKDQTWRRPKGLWIS